MVFSAISAVATALSPTLPYILLCTAAVLFDCFTAWQLDKRVRKAFPEQTTTNAGKFKSSHFGSVLLTLLQVYALLVFAHFLHIYVTENLPFHARKSAVAEGAMMSGWSISAFASPMRLIWHSPSTIICTMAVLPCSLSTISFNNSVTIFPSKVR